MPNPDRVRELGVDPDRPSVIFVGRITRQKGLPLFLRAAAALPPDVQLVLCAGAPDTPEIEAEVRGLVEDLAATRSGVVWIAEMLPRPDVVALLTAATVFACPSIYEPLGIVNLEAMACETAVVATATGGIPEVVVDGETGWLVPIEQATDGTGTPLDPERYVADLAAALTDAVSDPDRARAYGVAGPPPRGGVLQLGLDRHPHPRPLLLARLTVDRTERPPARRSARGGCPGAGLFGPYDGPVESDPVSLTLRHAGRMEISDLMPVLGGVATRELLVRLTSRRALEAALAAGALVRVNRGRYAVPGVARRAPSWRSRSRATCAWSAPPSHHGWKVKVVPDLPQVAVPKDRRIDAAVRSRMEVTWTDLADDAGRGTRHERDDDARDVRTATAVRRGAGRR